MSLGPAEIVGSSGYTAVGHRKMMRAEGEFERHQLPAGIRRCGGGMEPPGRDPAERREKRGGPGSEEPHDAGGIRRHRGQQRKVGRKILRECGGLKFRKVLLQGESAPQRLMHWKVRY